MLVNVPLMVGLALLAEPAVVVLFGEHWRPAAPILSILALSGVLFPLHSLNLQTLLAHGGSARFFRIELAKKLMGAVLIVIGALYGAVGLAWAQVALSIIVLHLNVAPIGQRIGYGTLAQLRDLSGLVVPTSIMAAGVWTLGHLLHSPIILLLVAVPAGGSLFVAVCAVLRVRAFGDAMTLMQETIVKRRRKPVTPAIADPVGEKQQHPDDAKSDPTSCSEEKPNAR